MIKIVLNGCCGKMGKVITECASKFNNLEIVAGIDKFPHETSYPIFETPEDLNLDYDVLLDFSRAGALKGLISLTEKTKKPLVICSTGFSDEDLALIEEKSRTLPLFRSANMSLGINLINSLLRKVTPLLYGNYDIEIIEKHHNQKVDSPSGTAVLLADTIKDSINEETKFVYGRSGLSKREENEIGIHAIRGGSIVGDHDVIFAGVGEVIELSHKAISRDVFAIGALKACEYMGNISNPGLYTMDDVIGITK
ncbi:4-hydroxy-tetrahydrodipicolinate reductase [Clostridium botulinum]|uniref:4-hydroxy-tetrahydrodipicolinate reductase n=1 Tax=Clostridium botulinum TaxID=1491 RepID=UPI0013FB084F|nr:4-hydroxy-tetrahydrodipicolinate reductase [Clostridium botulinum]MBN1059052.1 4-hydroxy-tetrahydrodipicolinate reductase [Clostridium botulinum]MBN1062223.1 4-hydroxy-tetrahydrodipicolinate reductase [Clostridium botulinum]NFF81328.1 4-hydroxy-tetrahydrodipicolinate reductase [Clostridium botulinum]NFG59450.1 4-hydroxy-tetrahydrodipicolinate reductase [Clostridium botulinum]